MEVPMVMSNAERQRLWRLRRKEERRAAAITDTNSAAVEVSGPEAPLPPARLTTERQQQSEPAALPQWYSTVVGDRVVRRRLGSSG
jgi:hypothetical protein